jgi:hypothetical protein
MNIYCLKMYTIRFYKNHAAQQHIPDSILSNSWFSTDIKVWLIKTVQTIQACLMPTAGLQMDLVQIN